MITKPTVLVLGAGASIPYGYPSGAGLVRDIFQGISNTAWRELFDACGVTVSEMETLKSELHLSQKPSIDAFLEHRTEFMKAGKIAIALSLLSKENPDALIDFDIREKGIYHFLYNSLAASWEEFKENKLTVVTFNYDRSLEHFLFSALKHSYDKSDIEIAEAMQKIPIVHVHGSLGPLSWQVIGGNNYYPLFGRKDDGYVIGKRIRVATENIVIVSEAEPKSKEFALATQLIKEAERVYFLGFGYYPVNLERLGLMQSKVLDSSVSVLDLFFDSNTDLYRRHEDKKNSYINYWLRDGLANSDDGVVYSVRHFRGSALGLGAAQIQSIQKKWHIGLPDNKCNALEFLKEYAELS